MSESTKLRDHLWAGDTWGLLRAILELESTLPHDDWIELVHDCAVDCLFSRIAIPVALVLVEELLRREPESGAFEELRERTLMQLRGVAYVNRDAPRLRELIARIAGGESLSQDERAEIQQLLSS